MTVVARGCGERVAGGVYLVAPMGPDGKPVEHFIIDPPEPVNIETAGLSAIGTTIAPRSYRHPETKLSISTHFVFDIVGEEHYPNVADFIEEVRRFGLSRRIAKNMDFSKLDAFSRIVLVHRRAHIINANEYQEARDPERFWCPRDIPHHMKAAYRGMCAALWWQDVTGGVAPDEGSINSKLTHGLSMRNDQPGIQMHLERESERAVVREMPSFRYRGMKRPDEVTPQYTHAAFATFPIGVIEVVRDPAGQSHLDAMLKARKAKIDVQEVNE